MQRLQTQLLDRLALDHRKALELCAKAYKDKSRSVYAFDALLHFEESWFLTDLMDRYHAHLFYEQEYEEHTLIYRENIGEVYRLVSSKEDGKLWVAGKALIAGSNRATLNKEAMFYETLIELKHENVQGLKDQLYRTFDFEIVMYEHCQYGSVWK